MKKILLSGATIALLLSMTGCSDDAAAAKPVNKNTYNLRVISEATGDHLLNGYTNTETKKLKTTLNLSTKANGTSEIDGTAVKINRITKDMNIEPSTIIHEINDIYYDANGTILKKIINNDVICTLIGKKEVIPTAANIASSGKSTMDCTDGTTITISWNLTAKDSSNAYYIVKTETTGTSDETTFTYTITPNDEVIYTKMYMKVDKGSVTLEGN